MREKGESRAKRSDSTRSAHRRFGKCGGPLASSNTVGIPTIYALGVGAPAANMMQNYPNPVKDQTTIKYRLSEDASVNISVYDMSGRKVAVLINQNKQGSGT